MQFLGLLLLLINIGAVAGPVAGVAIVYREDLGALVVPPELQEIAQTNILMPDAFELPQVVDTSFDVESRTVKVIFNFTNPFNLNLTVNALSADVKCNEHAVILGQARFENPFQMNYKETVDITIVFTWTQVAEEHFLTEHSGEDSINVSLLNWVVDVNGITVQTPETVDLGALPLHS